MICNVDAGLELGLSSTFQAKTVHVVTHGANLTYAPHYHLLPQTPALSTRLAVLTQNDIAPGFSRLVS